MSITELSRTMFFPMKNNARLASPLSVLAWSHSLNMPNMKMFEIDAPTITATRIAKSIVRLGCLDVCKPHDARIRLAW